jgi:hypothetical protein
VKNEKGKKSPKRIPDLVLVGNLSPKFPISLSVGNSGGGQEVKKKAGEVHKLNDKTTT